MVNDRRLLGICPYFTMFPLAFPLAVLAGRASAGDGVLDPFCGRGTTNFAARLLGLPTLGIDSNPVAVAITAAKLVRVSAGEVVREARGILRQARATVRVPCGEFWDWAYEAATLGEVCRLREALAGDCASPARIALRGVALGALHGPVPKGVPSYFSNQCPRTYGPKPGYAVRFWRARGLRPRWVDVLGVIERRAERYYGAGAGGVPGAWRLADSRAAGALDEESGGGGFRWVITSPPYYGMRTYGPDQWLRNWFLGGGERVEYACHGQVVHGGPEAYVRDLAAVWRNAARVCAAGAEMVIRFGGIRDRRADPLELIVRSLGGTGWRIGRIVPAGTAADGRRQADGFLRRRSRPVAEHDVWARREGD